MNPRLESNWLQMECSHLHSVPFWREECLSFAKERR
jgi:hypothetical protein